MGDRSPSDLQGFENQLPYVLNYEEPGRWSRLVTVPQRGILITPPQSEAMSYRICRR